MTKKMIQSDSPAAGDTGPQSACHEQRFASSRPLSQASGSKDSKDGSQNA